MWSGQSSNIPSGWALCDGQNGTPNLQDRFIVGAGKQYTEGATGGADSVTLTTDQMPSHNHHVSATNGIYGDTGGNDYKQWFVMGTASSPITNCGAVDYRGIFMEYVGSDEAHENRPPYYALCFIMKL